MGFSCLQINQWLLLRFRNQSIDLCTMISFTCYPCQFSSYQTPPKSDMGVTFSSTAASGHSVLISCCLLWLLCNTQSPVRYSPSCRVNYPRPIACCSWVDGPCRQPLDSALCTAPPTFSPPTDLLLWFYSNLTLWLEQPEEKCVFIRGCAGLEKWREMLICSC